MANHQPVIKIVPNKTTDKFYLTCNICDIALQTLSTENAIA